MLATLGGYLALLLGLAILLLPLLATELSRPRDSAWGAVVLLLGLVLVTTADRLSGAPMLGVLCGGLLIGRLGMEVGQARWLLLSAEEQKRLWSRERWQTSLGQTGAAMAQLLAQVAQASAVLGSWLAERRQSRPASTKRWVRPEPDQAAEPTAAEPPAELSADEQAQEEPAQDKPPAGGEPKVIEVSSFDELDALIEAAPADASALEVESDVESTAEVTAEPEDTAAADATPPDQPHSEAG